MHHDAWFDERNSRDLQYHFSGFLAYLIEINVPDWLPRLIFNPNGEFGIMARYFKIIVSAPAAKMATISVSGGISTARMCAVVSPIWGTMVTGASVEKTTVNKEREP